MPIMDHHPRASMARISQQANHQKQKREDDRDGFILTDSEIMDCINGMGIGCTMEDLRKPNTQQIQKVYEWFAEFVTDTTREAVAPAMCAAAEDMHGSDDADRIFTADTRELMGFFIIMRKLLIACGINDFTFSDLYRPTSPRFVKIFSYMINFIRFQESQTSMIDQHYNSSERTKNQIEELQHSNQEKEDRLDDLQRNQKSVQQAIDDMERKNQELKRKLLELKKAQEQVVEKVEQNKGESNRLKGMAEERIAKLMDIKSDISKLRPYAETSLAELETSLRDLNSKLNGSREEIDFLEKRMRGYQTSHESFTYLRTRITSLIRLQTELQNELQKEEEEARLAAQNRELLMERSNEVREVERQEILLSKQLKQWQDRTEKLRRDTEAKEVKSKDEMKNLQENHQALSKERRERSEEVERKKLRIEQTAKKMKDLKVQIEREVSIVMGEFKKLDSHIQLYIQEMEQSIDPELKQNVEEARDDW